MVLRPRNENTGALKRTCHPLHEEMPRHLLTALFPKTRRRLALQVTACPWKIGSSGLRVLLFFLGRGRIFGPLDLLSAIFSFMEYWGLGWLWYTLKISFGELTEVSHQTLIFDHLLSIVQICADTFIGSFKVQISWEAQRLDNLESISCGKQSTHSVPQLAHQLLPKPVFSFES